MNTSLTIMILYDGIKNSIFQSQVIEPLKKISGPVHIISYEKHELSSEECSRLIPKQFSYTLFKNNPFLGIWSLGPAIWDLQDYLKNLRVHEYHIIARGPHAGYIALESLDARCKQLTIQARGLIAEEYYYHMVKKKGFLGRIIGALRYILFSRLEYFTYRAKNIRCPYTIETVSLAFRSYLIQRFDADRTRITIAHNDIPMPLITEQRSHFRAAIKMQLGIMPDTVVYCYNGSAKLWQCPRETIQFFKEELTKNPSAHLLLLTQDQAAFNELIKTYDIPSTTYTMLTLDHKEVMPYLCAADFGILFREKHIINWVSRPTKALEYKAAGLKIIHNNTVGCVNLDQL